VERSAANGGTIERTVKQHERSIETAETERSTAAESSETERSTAAESSEERYGGEIDQAAGEEQPTATGEANPIE
jgi:hypothetical protein